MLNKKDLKSAFSKRLQELMIEKNINQKELAKGVDTSQQAIQQYIAMESAPKMEMFVAIADFFEVSCDYLLGRVETRTLDVNVQNVVNKYGLRESSLKKLERLVEEKNRPYNPLDHPEQKSFGYRTMLTPYSAINALNCILSWKNMKRLLLNIYDFLSHGSFIIYDDKPIQLTQCGRSLDYELKPGRINDVIFSGIKDMLCELHDDIHGKDGTRFPDLLFGTSKPKIKINSFDTPDHAESPATPCFPEESPRLCPKDTTDGVANVSQ
jgi:transcriptional regulator with XRE-family HTH domain